MRTLALVPLLAFLALPAAAEDGPAVLKIEIGKEAAISGYRPICDDPSIATVTAEGRGTLKALKIGETTCSWSVGTPLGMRRIVRVVVVPPPAKGPDGEGPGAQEG